MIECGNCGEAYSERCPVCPGCCDDLQYDRLDNGIRETVRLLRRHGFETTDSGDGDITPRPWDKLPWGHVVVVVGAAEDLVAHARDLTALLASHGLDVTTRPPDVPPDGEVIVEASFTPADDIAVIVVSHILDRMWTA